MIRDLSGPRQAAHPTDAELLQAFLADRDEDAFAALVSRYAAMVMRLCRNALSHKQDAEDAFQVTFLVLCHKAADLEKRQSVGSWLFGVARRVASNVRRDRTRRRVRDGRGGSGESADPLAELTVREARAILQEELDRLPAKFRDPFVLCVLEGHTRDESARRLGVTPDSLKYRLERARKRLRERLTARGVGLPGALVGVALCGAGRLGAVPASLVTSTARAAAGVAAGLADSAVPAGVASLAKGVAKAMSLQKLMKSAFGLCAALTLLAVGAKAALSAAEVPPSPQVPGGPPVPVKARAVRGRVLDAAGKPVPGAKILSLGKAGGPTLLGTASKDGRFSVAVGGQLKGRYLLTRAAGFGIDFVDLGRLDLSKGVEFRVAERQAIRGRVLSTEGKPVGGVTVTGNGIAVWEDDSLDRLLTAWKKLTFASGLPGGDKNLGGPLAALFSTRTDKDGRFELRGIGRGRFVTLRLSGAGIADTIIGVATSPSLDPEPYNEAVLRNTSKSLRRMIPPYWILYGPDLTVIAEPGRALRGVVKDADTGRARPGVDVWLARADGKLLRAVIRTKTDAAGRYEISGAGNAKSYTLEVFSDPASGHLACQTRIAADAPGYKPVAADIRVKRGVVVTGRVIDRATGKGVPGWAAADPLAGNRFVKDYPQFGASAWPQRPNTAADGTFRIVTVPGPVVLMGGADGQRLPGGPAAAMKYRPVAPDPAFPKYFHKGPTSLGPGPIYYGYDGKIRPLDGNHCEVLTLKRGAAPVTRNVPLRTGPGVSLRLLGPDGRPLRGALVAGLMPPAWDGPTACQGATCTAYHLDADAPREFIFFHRPRRLARAITLKGGERQPVSVKLQPTGSVKGRLRGEDGKPLAGLRVGVEYTDAAAAQLHRAANGDEALADVRGEFRIDGVIPGVPFRLSFLSDRGGRMRRKRPAAQRPPLRPAEVQSLGRIELTPAGE